MNAALELQCYPSLTYLTLVKFFLMQVKDLTSKTHHLEQELERTIKQLNEAKAAAAEESAKYKSAMEVVESLTAQVRLSFYDFLAVYQNNTLMISVCIILTQ